MSRLIMGTALALALSAAIPGAASAQNATVGGAAVGAATGALVGPVGAVVGGAAGLAAGSVVDRSYPRAMIIEEPMATGSIVPGGVVVMDRRMQQAWDRCAQLYKTFNPATGEFVGEDGLIHLCQ